MEQTNQVFDANQPRLQDMSTEAYNAFKSISPEAFQATPFVTNAQNVAGAIGSGGLLGSNPGQATYDRLQRPTGGGLLGGDRSTGMQMMQTGEASRPMIGGGRGGDPSMGLLAGMATNGSAGAGTDMIRSAATDNSPTRGLYGEMTDRGYSTSNPFLNDIIRQNDENVTKQSNRLFGSRGMGAGIGSAYADVLTKNLADSGNQIRFQDYTNAENRRLQAAGQWDNTYNAGQDRSLAAGQALNQFDQANRAQQLSAAQSLGGQYNAGQDRSLDAARYSDAARSDQVNQMLQALGLTGDLRAAEFTGVNPALNLLNTAADIPYVGTAALNGQIRDASNGYGTTTTKTSGGLGSGLLGGAFQLGSAYLGRK